MREERVGSLAIWIDTLAETPEKMTNLMAVILDVASVTTTAQPVRTRIGRALALPSAILLAVAKVSALASTMRTSPTMSAGVGLHDAGALPVLVLPNGPALQVLRQGALTP